MGSTCLAFVRLGPSRFHILTGGFAVLRESMRVLVSLRVCLRGRIILLCQRRCNARLVLKAGRCEDYGLSRILQETVVKDLEVLLVLFLLVLFLELLL